MLANHENILTVHPVTDGRTRTEARTDGQFERPKLEHVERLPSLPTYVLRARARGISRPSVRLPPPALSSSPPLRLQRAKGKSSGNLSLRDLD